MNYWLKQLIIEWVIGEDSCSQSQIKNLEELMVDSEWHDWCSEEAICCSSHRVAYGFIGNIKVHIAEFGYCNAGCPHHIVVRDTATKDILLDYKIMPVYHRDPHSKQTYYRDSIQDLMTAPRIYP